MDAAAGAGLGLRSQLRPAWQAYTLPALRAHKYIDVRQLGNGHSLVAVRAGKGSNGVSFLVFAFRMYGWHGAIVARNAPLTIHVLPVTRFSFREPFESRGNTFSPGVLPLCFGNPLNIFASVTLAEAFEGLGGRFVLS